MFSANIKYVNAWNNKSTSPRHSSLFGNRIEYDPREDYPFEIEQLKAGTFNGTGGGAPGIPAGMLTLSNISQVLINNIGTCNTGIGVNVGHQLTYTLGISNYSALQSSSSTVNILFTITQ